MIICLSSGTRPRYKQDILRALSLPVGSLLQFRYDREWVSNAVLQMIENGKMKGQEVIIAYADQHHPGNGNVRIGSIELVPIRLGEIVSASLPGHTVSLLFSLGKLSHASDLSAFNNEVSNLTGHSLPKWIDNTPKGVYCTELNSRPTNFVEAEELRLWEDIIAQLSGRQDFASEETFFTILGLLTDTEIQAMGASLKHQTWPKQLPANAYRSLFLYHYHPHKSPTNLLISASTGPELHLGGRAFSLGSNEIRRRYPSI